MTSGEGAEPRLGVCMPLSRIPLGMTVHNIELTPGRGGQICRSAGCKATLTNRDKEWAQVTMPSGEIRRIHSKCRATIGSVSFPDHMNVSIGKAGRARWMGHKPHNRGTSMNPTDHPMGGGEGPDRRRWRPAVAERGAVQGRQDSQEAEAGQQRHRPPAAGRAVPDEQVKTAAGGIGLRRPNAVKITDPVPVAGAD